MIGATVTYLAIIAGTLLLADLVCMALGLFPPMMKYGDPDLGWRPAPATGHMKVDRCEEFSTGATHEYVRNEDGVRTALSRRQLESNPPGVRIAVTGDSQTDLCAPNSETHAGVLESQLTAGGVPTTVLAYGSGRYSPVQAYLAFRTVLKPYGPQVLVMNLYTGNDFYDLLRTDDRPHLVRADGGYRVAKPNWFLYDDPATRFRSRVLFAARSVADVIGLRSVYFRLLELRRLAAEQGKGLPTVLSYMLSLRKATEPSLGYPGAFAAQMLNQQLFFRYFPAAETEALNRLGALMDLARRENPGLVLVMSPLPSYQLVGQQPLDEAFHRTLDRLGVTAAESAREEEALYQRLRSLAAERQWLFVDNLAALRAYGGTERLYNAFDYHLLPSASAVIGRAEAAALRARLGRGR